MRRRGREAFPSERNAGLSFFGMGSRCGSTIATEGAQGSCRKLSPWLVSIGRYTRVADMSAPITSKHRTLERLTIEKFRGIKSLMWDPAPGVDFVLGGDDAGKTTISDAIALLLKPHEMTLHLSIAGALYCRHLLKIRP